MADETRTVGGLPPAPTYGEMWDEAVALGQDPPEGITETDLRELLDAYGDDATGTVYNPKATNPFAASRTPYVKPADVPPVVEDPFDDGPAEPEALDQDAYDAAVAAMQDEPPVPPAED